MPIGLHKEDITISNFSNDFKMVGIGSLQYKSRVNLCVLSIFRFIFSYFPITTL